MNHELNNDAKHSGSRRKNNENFLIFVCGEAQTMEQSMLLLLFFFFFFFLGGLLWFSIFFKILKSL